MKILFRLGHLGVFAVVLLSIASCKVRETESKTLENTSAPSHEFKQQISCRSLDSIPVIKLVSEGSTSDDSPTVPMTVTVFERDTNPPLAFFKLIDDSNGRLSGFKHSVGEVEFSGGKLSAITGHPPKIVLGVATTRYWSGTLHLDAKNQSFEMTCNWSVDPSPNVVNLSHDIVACGRKAPNGFSFVAVDKKGRTFYYEDAIKGGTRYVADEFRFVTDEFNRELEGADSASTIVARKDKTRIELRQDLASATWNENGITKSYTQCRSFPVAEMEKIREWVKKVDLEQTF